MIKVEALDTQLCRLCRAVAPTEHLDKFLDRPPFLHPVDIHSKAHCLKLGGFFSKGKTGNLAWPMVMIRVFRGQFHQLHGFQHSPALVLAELTGS